MDNVKHLNADRLRSASGMLQEAIVASVSAGLPAPSIGQLQLVADEVETMLRAATLKEYGAPDNVVDFPDRAA